MFYISHVNYNNSFFNVREAFARVRCDRLLLASSVIAAACWLQERDELFDSVVKRLCSVNEIPAEDVITFSESIVNLLFSF